MKLVRLTDDRYILDGGRDITAAQMEAIRDYWTEWWQRHLTAPEVIVIGGNEFPLEYEDRREPDLESRLQSIEAALAHLSTHTHHVRVVGEQTWEPKP